MTVARPTDTERGARIAYERASAMLAAAEAKDLFPIRLTRAQRQLWTGIRDAASEQLAEERALKELRA